MKHWWQLKDSIDAYVLDCDGTLSHIEGINFLAEKNGVGEEVSRLTARAMNETGITSSLYHKRIFMVRPTYTQIYELGSEYYRHKAPDTSAVIRILQSLNKSLYILSAGNNPAVKIYAELLGIPSQNVYAVDVHFDEKGEFTDYDRTSPLTSTNGKREIIKHLTKIHPRIVHIGDGMNDYESHDLVERFIGYGGSYYRDNIAQLCKFYIKAASLAPLLPLSLTAEEAQRLTPTENAIYQKGMELICSREVIVREKQAGHHV